MAEDEWIDREVPDDDVLREVGCLAWHALNLEYEANTVCRTVKPRGGQYDDKPIGPRIEEARKDLLLGRDKELTDRADAWLAEAAGALEERNHVLHSVPGTMVPYPDT